MLYRQINDDRQQHHRRCGDQQRLLAGEHPPCGAVVAVRQKIKVKKPGQHRDRPDALQMGDGPLLAPLVQPQQQKTDHNRNDLKHINTLKSLRPVYHRPQTALVFIKSRRPHHPSG